VKWTRLPLLVAACCLLGAAPAQAAFAPDLTVGITPDTPGGAPTLMATISQPAVESPIRRFTLNLPPGFTAASAPGASSCTVALVLADGCPADTRIGTVGAWLGPADRFVGSIHKTGPHGFAIALGFVGGPAGAVVEGSVAPRGDGSIDIRFDRLPTLPLTTLAFHLDGGPRSFVRAPAECGSYTIDGKFTSHAEDLAIDRTVMPFTGCTAAARVEVSDVQLTDARFRAGGRPGSYRTVITWRASGAADHTDIRIERRTRRGWRKRGVLVGAGQAGDNRVLWDGRVGGRRLKPGRYALRVQPDGARPAKRVRFRIVR